MQALFGIEQVKQLAPFMCKEPTRFYLAGIFFDSGYMVATTGHILGVIKAPASAGVNKLLPAKAVAQLTKLKTGSKTGLLFGWDGKTVTAYEYPKPTKSTEQPTELDSRWPVVATFDTGDDDITYPDWRRVIPARPGKDSGANCAFNSDCLTAFAMPGDKSAGITIVPVDSSRALVINRNPNFLGVIMQLGYMPSAAEAITRAGEFSGVIARAA